MKDPREISGSWDSDVTCVKQSTMTMASQTRSTNALRPYILNWRSLGRILVQVTIYRRLLIGRDGHLDQSEAYDIS